MSTKPTSEETMVWSESVDTLLAHKSGQVAFRTFLKKEFSDENIDFWLICEDYKKTKSATKLASKAKKIYSEFIESNAPKEINIDFVTREAITRNIGKPTHSSFDVAQEVIYSLMAKDCYPRFLRSDTYLELVKSSGCSCSEIIQSEERITSP